jgi:hypothetical protein
MDWNGSGRKGCGLIEVLLRHLPGGVKAKPQDNRCPCRDSNREFSEYKSRTLPLHLPTRLHSSYVYFSKNITVSLFWIKPITVAARPKVWTVVARSNTGIVGLNSTRSMDVCVCVCVRLFCVCVVLCVGSGLATGWSPVQGVLPTLCRLRNWKSGQDPQGL